MKEARLTGFAAKHDMKELKVDGGVGYWLTGWPFVANELRRFRGFVEAVKAEFPGEGREAVEVCVKGETAQEVTQAVIAVGPA